MCQRERPWPEFGSTSKVLLWVNPVEAQMGLIFESNSILLLTNHATLGDGMMDPRVDDCLIGQLAK